MKDIDEKILKLLELLVEKPEKGFEEKKLLKKGFNKKELNEIHSLITNSPGVRPIFKVSDGKKVIWKLSSGWEKYRNKLIMRDIAKSQNNLLEKQTSFSKWLTIATIGLVIVTGFLVFVTIKIGNSSDEIFNKQNEILNKQTEILDKQSEIIGKSSQSIRPDLIAFSTRGYRKFPLDLVNNGEDQTISLTVMNMGKSTATYAKIPVAPYTLFIGQYKKGEDVGENSIFYINQLKSLDSRAQTLDFRLNPSKEEILTPGVKNLTMRIYCDSCNEQRKYQIIPICIYNNDSTIIEECGHEWI